MSSIDAKIIGNKKKILKIIERIHKEDLIEIKKYSELHGKPTITAPSNRLKIHYRSKGFDCMGKYGFVEKECYFTDVPNKSNIDYYFHLD